MIDYRDFVQQAEIDLDRSTKLFESKDYGGAMFSAQQGLEKYLKAYLLKLNIFSNPKELGHVQYGKIFESVIEIISKREKIDGFTPILESLKNMLEKFKNLAKNIETNPQVKILAWKESLKIPLTSNENSINQGLATSFREEVNEFENNMQNLISRGDVFDLSFLDGVDQSQIPENIKNTIELIKKLNNQFNEIFKNSNSSSEMMKTMFEMMSQMSYGKGTNTLSKGKTDELMKGLVLLKSLNWFDMAMKTYPHEEISRYSTDIDNQTSIELYQKYSNNVGELITETKATCTEIKDSLQQFHSLNP